VTAKPPDRDLMLYALETYGGIVRSVTEQAQRLVQEMRDAGFTWEEIAKSYGVSVSVARRQFGGGARRT
jgi:uncharacterized protein Smg (DUF494 family)